MTLSQTAVLDTFATPLCTAANTAQLTVTVLISFPGPVSDVRQMLKIGVCEEIEASHVFLCHTYSFSLVSVRKEKALSPLVRLQDREQQGWHTFRENVVSS